MSGTRWGLRQQTVVLVGGVVLAAVGSLAWVLHSEGAARETAVKVVTLVATLVGLLVVLLRCCGDWQAPRGR
jgi:hypothetical protein